MNNYFFCSYHLILDESKEENIQAILNRLNEESPVFDAPSTIQPFHKELNKTEVFGNMSLPELEFENALMWLLKHFQFHFYGWRISGDYENEIIMKADKFREPAICFASFILSRWG